MSGIRPRSSDTTHELDLRALAPAATVDANGNTGRSAFDPLGRVVAGGLEGHVGAQPWGSGPLGAWTPPAGTTLAAILADPRGFLGTASSATWTDDRAWEERQAPVAVVSVARAALVHDGDGGGAADGPLEVAVRYLDGFGRVLQEKVRVEPGPAITRDASGAVVVDAQGPVLAHAAERYRVSGHVVYDAKGQPIRVFEPYFSPVAGYEADAVLQAFGVSTLTIYDAAGRPVRVDHPNGTYERVRYRPWSTEASSPGDNVLDSAYRVLREGRAPDDAERVAYEHAASHAGTPTVTHVDARGAVCLTVAVGDATAEARRVRQVTDASGQVTTTIDPRGLVAFRYWRDLRGRVLATDSVDAGPAWSLPDGFDRPALGWDARGHRVVRSFDVADRPVAVQVYDGDAATPLDHVVEQYRYGDEDADRASARAANTLGRLVTVKDEAGELRTASYDPAGAPRSSERRLRQTVDDAPDWRQAVAVEAEALTSAAVTDALGRVVWQRFADGSERRDSYHVGGALAAVTVTTPDGALVAAPVVSGLARDARGRMAGAQLGNGCVQAWRYDRDTGRLVAQDATHGGRALQRLRFTYDADGKLVRALDLAQDGASAVLPSAVSARRDYVYDAHGRLVEATGRVHQALLPHDYIPGTAGTMSGTRHLSLDNGAALERYTQRFSYDASGNLLRVQHAGATASWATDYWVAGGSNRSTAALDPNGLPVVNPAGMFDATGNLRELAHLRSIAWSWRGCLARAVTIARAGGVDDDERYAYGADRMRVRKVATRLVGGDSVETREVVYVGDQERVRVRRDGVIVLERWTTHVGDGERRVAVVDRHTVDTLGHEVDQIGPARVRYHLTTSQGSTALELDEAGGLVSYEEYLPHGGSAFIAGDSARDVARRDVRYAGKERDRATGLHAYPYRYYAPWLGRWLSPDPIGPEDDLNLYQFVLGDPVGNVDPEGLDTPENEDRLMKRHDTPRPERASGRADAAAARNANSDAEQIWVWSPSRQDYVPRFQNAQGAWQLEEGDEWKNYDIEDTAPPISQRLEQGPPPYTKSTHPWLDFYKEALGEKHAGIVHGGPQVPPGEVDYEALRTPEWDRITPLSLYSAVTLGVAKQEYGYVWADLLRDGKQSERVRLDAQAGDERGVAVWKELKEAAASLGTRTGARIETLACTFVPVGCVFSESEFDKNFADPSSSTAAAELRGIFFASLEDESRKRANENRALLSVVGALVAMNQLRGMLNARSAATVPPGGKPPVPKPPVPPVPPEPPPAAPPQAVPAPATPPPGGPVAAPTTPGVPRPGGAALTAGRRALTAGDEAIAPATAGYVNNNPAATAREVQVGTILDEQAQTGALRDVARVEGMPESKTARRADYDFVMADGSRITADLYEPGTAQPRAVGSMMVKKSGQATAMVVDLKGGSASMPIPDLVEEIRGKLGTPGLSIDRVVVVRDGAIIVDLTR